LKSQAYLKRQDLLWEHVKVSIIGAGNGGCATAVELTLKGFDITLCSAYAPNHILPLMNKGGLEYSGSLGEGFVNLRATIDIQQGVEDAQLILMVTPSPIHEVYAKMLAPLLRRKQIPIVLSGSGTGGALHVYKILKEMGINQPIIGETDILPYAARLVSPIHIKIFHKVKWRLFSCFPSQNSGNLYSDVKSAYPELELAENVLQTSLSNINAILHPPGMVLNAGWIESTGGDFLFYSQGVTSAIAQVIAEIDAERIEILRKVGLKSMGLVELLNRYGFSSVDSNFSVLESIKSSSTISEIRSPNTLSHRYLMEDVGYGLVPMSQIAKIFGVETQSMDSLINLACILNEADHWKEGMTFEKMGISNLRQETINLYLEKGINA
jgi:opine dehydrogenase